MTEKFYCIFLEYLSERERQALCGYLQQKKIRINGFRAIRDVPNRILATHIARYEESFFEILLEFYLPTYVDKDEAVHFFSPDTALKCLSYFVKDRDFDEQMLSSLLIKNTVSTLPQKPTIENRKILKKTEEFRQKYLETHKELECLKKELELTRNDNNNLKIQLRHEEINLKEALNKLNQLKEDHNKSLLSLRKNISELEMEISEQKKVCELQNNQILVLSNVKDVELPGVLFLQYNNISSLESKVNNYLEVLFVVNDLPFYIKRQVYRINGIEKKIHLFSTYFELMEYIHKRR